MPDTHWEIRFSNLEALFCGLYSSISGFAQELCKQENDRDLEDQEYVRTLFADAARRTYKPFSWPEAIRIEFRKGIVGDLGWIFQPYTTVDHPQPKLFVSWPPRLKSHRNGLVSNLDSDQFKLDEIQVPTLDDETDTIDPLEDMTAQKWMTIARFLVVRIYPMIRHVEGFRQDFIDDPRAAFQGLPDRACVRVVEGGDEIVMTSLDMASKNRLGCNNDASWLLSLPLPHHVAYKGPEPDIELEEVADSEVVIVGWPLGGPGNCLECP